MGQFFKICGLLGAGALAAAATPAWAGGHFVGHGFAGRAGGARFMGPARFAAGPAVRPGVGIRPRMAFRPGIHPGFRPGFDGFHRRFFGRGPGFYGSFGRFGFDYGYAFPRGVYAPGYWGGGYLPAGDYSYYAAAAYPSYPVGYDGASYAPTGNGVVYNVPPPGCCAPKIIYLSGNHVRRETTLRPRQVIVVRGAASVD